MSETLEAPVEQLNTVNTQESGSSNGDNSEKQQTMSSNRSYESRADELPQEPLYGRELLHAVESIKADKSEKAIQTGHYSVNDEGKVRAKNTQFLEALCEAKSIPFKDKPGLGNKRGRSATYYTKVQQPGSITVGRRYVEEWGLSQGDPVKIEVKRKQLILRKLEESEIEDFNKQEQAEKERQEQEELENSQETDAYQSNGQSYNSSNGEINSLLQNDDVDDTENDAEEGQPLNDDLDW